MTHPTTRPPADLDRSHSVLLHQRGRFNERLWRMSHSLKLRSTSPPPGLLCLMHWEWEPAGNCSQGLRIILTKRAMRDFAVELCKYNFLGLWAPQAERHLVPLHLRKGRNLLRPKISKKLSSSRTVSMSESFFFLAGEAYCPFKRRIMKHLSPAVLSV